MHTSSSDSPAPLISRPRNSGRHKCWEKISLHLNAWISPSSCLVLTCSWIVCFLLDFLYFWCLRQTLTTFEFFKLDFYLKYAEFFLFFTWFDFYLDISYKENAMRYLPSYMHAHGKQESYLWWTWPLATPGGCLRWRTEVTPACPRPSPRCRLLARRIRCHLWCIHLCQGQGRIVGRRRDSNIKHLSGMKCQPLNLTMFLFKAFFKRRRTMSGGQFDTPHACFLHYMTHFENQN